MNSKNNSEGFNFSLNQNNKITPRQLRRVDIMHLIRTNNIPELNAILNDLSQENFEESDYFDFTKDELKLIKNYQVLTQYMIYSINQLSRKSEKLNELTKMQIQVNQKAEQSIKNKQNIIKEQEEEINELSNDCANLEFLIKQLNLEDKAKQEGVNIGNTEYYKTK